MNTSVSRAHTLFARGLWVTAALLGSPTIPAEAAGRPSFDERVRAQEAIARTYYRHRIGADAPFDVGLVRRYGPTDPGITVHGSYTDASGVVRKF